MFNEGVMLLMMGTADELPMEPADKPVFVEDMSEQQLASAVSSFLFNTFTRFIKVYCQCEWQTLCCINTLCNDMNNKISCTTLTIKMYYAIDKLALLEFIIHITGMWLFWFSTNFKIFLLIFVNQAVFSFF